MKHTIVVDDPSGELGPADAAIPNLQHIIDDGKGTETGVPTIRVYEASPQLYVHAFCLDPGKASPGAEDLWIGPFDWVAIVWDNVKAGWDDREDMNDHQFIRDQSGFWYPMLYLSTNRDNMSHSMIPDYGRGRFTDIEMCSVEEHAHKDAAKRAWRELRYDDNGGRHAAELAEEHERAWLLEGDEPKTIAFFAESLEFDADHAELETFGEFVESAPDSIAELWGNDGPGKPYLLTQGQLDQVIRIIGDRVEDQPPTGSAGGISNLRDDLP